MISTTYGDMAKWHIARNQTSEIKQNLRTLTEELTSGVKSDLAKHLGFDRIRVAQIDETIERIDAYSEISNNVKSFLQTQQISLDSIEDNRMELASISINVTAASSQTSISIISEEGKTRFGDMIRALRADFAGQSVFSGNKTDTAPLPSSETLITDLKASINFAQPAADVIADIKTYFTDPSGPYIATHYSGGNADGMERKISGDKSVTLGTTAADEGIAEVLAYTAAIALASEVSDTGARAELLSRAGVQLQSSSGVINTQSFIGLQQEKIQRSESKNAAEKTAISMERNDRVSADGLDTATKLKQNETQLQLHYTMIGRLSELSLMKYV